MWNWSHRWLMARWPVAKSRAVWLTWAGTGVGVAAVAAPAGADWAAAVAGTLGVGVAAPREETAAGWGEEQARARSSKPAAAGQRRVRRVRRVRRFIFLVMGSGTLLQNRPPGRP